LKKELKFFSGKLFLITGGSSGIGLSTAKKAFSYGASVWLIARDLSKLQNAIKEIELFRINNEQNIGFSIADISDEKQAFTAVNQVKEKIGLPDFVINSAGITHPGYFQDIECEVFRRQMEVNYFGTLYVIKGIIPDMIKRGSGYIVNISSLAGVIGTFGYTAYGASKFAVRGLSDTLRAEMKPLGINVSVVFPPDTDTPQLAYEAPLKPFETKIIAGSAGLVSPDKVAKDILNGIMRKRYLIFSGFEGKFLFWLSGFLGWLQYPVMDWMVSDAISKKKRYMAKQSVNH